MRAVLLIIGTVILFIVLFPTAMLLEQATSTEETLISKALSSKKISFFSKSLERNVYNNINGKPVNYNLLNVDFISGKTLIDRKIEDFYSVSAVINMNTALVNVSHYKTGILYSFSYEKRENLWQEIKSEFGRVKFEPSKPYYIYYKIIKGKYPDYMNWDKFPIPNDSLR